MLCALSRALNLCLTGRREMLCTSAALHGWRLQRLLDAVLWLYDGTEHCRRMAEHECRGWGVRDPLRGRRDGL